MSPPSTFDINRERMIEEQLVARGITDQRVLEAMRTVPRHLFVEDAIRAQAYGDFPLPIGSGQTISQPYVVALMTLALRLTGSEKVLEIGTGSGYQAAILSRLARVVYTIEIVEPLCREAAATLGRLGFSNVEVRCGDGFVGWPEEAPFDAIMLTASPENIPNPLVEQLAPGGRMILPLGGHYQELVLIQRSLEGQLSRRELIPVRFVPMTGEAETR